MGVGFRGGLKKIIPGSLWPFCRFFDRYLINAFYAYLAFVRFWADRFNRVRCKKSQSIPVVFSGINFGNTYPQDLAEKIEKAGLRFKSGRHSIYIDNPKDIEKINRKILDCYPCNVGLKISKSREISPDSTPYYTSCKLAPASTWFSMIAVGSLLEKTVISNLLHEEGLAPRVYDLVRLEAEDGSCQYGLIVQPVTGEVVVGDKGIEFVSRFRKAMKEIGMQTISIQEHCDLRPPDFRHNILSDSTGTYYVDIQNFVLFNRRFGKDLLKKMTALGRLTPSLLEREDNFSQKKPDTLAVFLSNNGVELQKAAILDFCLLEETVTISALTAGASWIVMIRPSDTVSLIRRYLYYFAFTRFDVFAAEDGCGLDWNSLPLSQYDLAFVQVEAEDSFLSGFELISVSYLVVIGSAGQSGKQLAAHAQKWPFPLEIVNTCRLHSDIIGSRAVVLGRIRR